MTNPDDPSGNLLPVDAKTSIEMMTDNAPADGMTANSAIASLDNAGDYKDNIFFTFTITKGSAVFVTTGQKTVTVKANPAFVASASFIDTSEETGEIEAFPTVNTALSDKTAFRFAAVPAKTNRIALAVTSDNASADGKAADTVVATLTDAGNQPLAGEKLKFELPAGSNATFDGDPGPVTVTTDDKGQASVRVTLKATQDTTVTVTCAQSADASVNRSIDTHFKAVLSPLRTLTLRVSKDNAPSNGTDYDTVIGQVLDQNQVPVAGEFVSFDISPPNSAVSFRGINPPVQVETDKDGRATVQIADGSKLADTLTVVGTLVSDSTVHDSTDIQFAAVVTPPPTQRSLTLQVTKNNATANGVDDDTLVATLLDQNNSPVAGESIKFDISPPNTALFIQGAAPPQLVATDSRGEALVRITDSAVHADSATVVASLVSDSSVYDSADIQFAALVNPPPPPPPQNPAISFSLQRGGITQALAYPYYDPARTARAYVYLKASDGTPVPYATVYLFVQSQGYMQSRIVALQDAAITPTAPAYAKADQYGRVQVNIAQWPGPNQCSGTVFLFANFSGTPASGPHLPITFHA